MAQPDIKQVLRKLEFPICAKEAINHIENIIANRGKQALIMQLISEFVFLERDPPKDFDAKKTPTMSTMQKFQFILVLVQYYSNPGPDETRNAMFLSLFGSNLTPHRINLLGCLISTAISGSVAPLLSSAGCWMQQIGCENTPALEVAKVIVTDFFMFCRRPSERLKTLPLVAPHFAANFMTTVTELYLNNSKTSTNDDPNQLPPDALIDVFRDWMSEHPTLFIASQQPLALPTGAIAMPAVSPVTGLIRWTVLAPLSTQRLAYSNLHLTLLQTLIEIKNIGASNTISSQQLCTIANLLQAQLVDYRNEMDKNEESFQKCLDFLAQTIHIALDNNCISGNIQHLLNALETLPENQLMSLIIKKNRIVS